MGPILGVLALGAVVGVRVTSVGDLGGAETELVEGLIAALDEKGLEADIDLGRIDCTDPASCVAALRRELGADEVLLIEILAGASSVRIDSARAKRGEVEPSTRNQQILNRGTIGLRGAARSLVRALYPQVDAQPPSLATIPQAPVEASLPIGPIVVFGGSAAMLTVATVLGLNSQAHFDRVEHEPLPPSENEALYSRARTEATVATALISVAAAGVLAGVVWLAAD